jgi:TetR/AcrR family transcriptional regulator, regulator of autoinduction and epiphytic fitness
MTATASAWTDKQPVRAQNSRNAILTAAKRLLLDRGFDAVSMDEIAAVAGVARRTVYNNFASKDAIFLGVIEEQWTSLDAAGLGLEHADDLPEAFLRAAANRSVSFITRPDQVAFAQTVIIESRRNPWIAQEFYRRGKAPVVHALTSYIANATARGLLICQYPEFAAYQFLGLLHEILLWPRVMANEADLKMPDPSEIVDEAVKMFLSRYST